MLIALVFIHVVCVFANNQDSRLDELEKLLKQQMFKLTEQELRIGNLEVIKNAQKSEIEQLKHRDYNQTKEITFLKQKMVNCLRDEDGLSENAIEKNILPRAFGQVVAFYAYMSKPQGNPGARHTLAFDVLRTNIYSGYNGATGIFTVPTSGVYIFTFTVRVICNSHFSFEIVQNGIVQGAVVVDTISQDAVCSSAHSTGTIVTPTLRGDTVLVRTHSTNQPFGGIQSNDQGRSSFAGWLIG
ncbi:C1QL [Mytilus edulis]|uniref:C1QL n=1 Tax=Mytilus edulis TaxID=6550 RepID=A0A8S3PX20_MYTED|nr:C1QL [Mytilus edulis]